jgi:hypothetical protein
MRLADNDQLMMSWDPDQRAFLLNLRPGVPGGLVGDVSAWTKEICDVGPKASL